MIVDLPGRRETLVKGQAPVISLLVVADGGKLTVFPLTIGVARLIQPAERKIINPLFTGSHPLQAHASTRFHVGIDGTIVIGISEQPI